MSTPSAPAPMVRIVHYEGDQTGISVEVQVEGATTSATFTLPFERFPDLGAAILAAEQEAIATVAALIPTLQGKITAIAGLIQQGTALLDGVADPTTKQGLNQVFADMSAALSG